MNKPNTIIIIIIGISFLAALLFYVRFYDHQIPIKIISFLVKYGHISLTKAEYKIYGSIIIFFSSVIGLSLACLYLQPPAPRTSHGTAAWATSAEMQTNKMGAILGKLGNKTIRSDYHALICAPSRSGKGVSSIIPNLLDHRGSLICLDIKGENFAVTARERRKYGQVHILDPYGIAGITTAAYNWLDSIDTNSPACISQAEILADMLTPGATDTYFDQAGKNLIKGLILYVCYKANDIPEKRHIGSVRNFLNNSTEQLIKILEDMASTEAIFGVLRSTAVSLLGASQLGAGKELSAVLNTARRFTSFLDDPRVIQTLSHSDFNLMAIKEEIFSVYVVIPPAEISQSRAYIRGFFGLALQAVTKNNRQPESKILFLLDEFAQLGEMKNIEDSISLVSGYGGQFLIYIQDLSQLRSVYKKSDTFLSNANRIFFSCNDYNTAKYISDSLGKKTIEVKNKSFSQGRETISYSEAARDLMTTEEIMNFDKNKSIAFIQFCPPAILDKIIYYKEKEYDGKFDKNPYIN